LLTKATDFYFFTRTFKYQFVLTIVKKTDIFGDICLFHISSQDPELSSYIVTPIHLFTGWSCFIVDCRKLNVRHLDDLQQDNIHTEFHENRSSFSRVEMAGYIDTQVHSDCKKFFLKKGL
jgi:hypothetical protein